MANMFRRLSDDFRVFMRANNALNVGETLINKKLEERQMKGMRSGTFNEWKSGKAVPEFYHERIIDLLRAEDLSPKLKRLQKAVLEYLKANQVGIDPIPPTNEIINAICTVPTELADDDHDFVSDGYKVVRYFMDRPGRLEHCCDPCPNEPKEIERWLPQAVKWLFVAVGRETSGDGKLPIEASMKAAEKVMHIKRDKYEERVRSWHATCPWTLALVRGEHGYVGMNIILPIVPESYATIRRGDMATWELKDTDLSAPSKHLIVEALCIRPPELGGPTRNATLSLIGSLMVQSSMLADLRGLGQQLRESDEISALAFAGTPKSRKRLLAHKYKPTKTTMKYTNVDLFERTFGPDRLKSEYIYFSLIFALAYFVPFSRREKIPRREKPESDVS